MEKPVPMDRLICGDVGYGKTEIAVRAAFKAVQDGKQVAVLVPTTPAGPAALQHVHRPDGPVPDRHPAAVPVPDAEGVEETLERLAEGTADIVIGTHRLLQTSTKFRELG
jgi:transcription-repair coupling factor (superfamily II helicase)